MLQWLRGVRMARRDTEPDVALLAELMRSAGPRLTCPTCEATGLAVGPAEPERDEDWQMARACESCGRPIARERLEVFPQTRLCVECQGKADRGERGGAQEVDYCPKCGSVMTLRQSRRGVTRYEMVCPQCRR
jgi:predicted RNA-binding Zn-ribbon protein involved in translation (DUF1610 family)